MRAKFIEELNRRQADFGIRLEAAAVERLADHYEMVQEHNKLLHLVAPSSPEEFATRHVLESLTLLDHLRPNARLADVGAGAGLPSIPCLIVRGDIRAVLIESKEKKAKFLREAVAGLGISDRAAIVNKQFEEVASGEFEVVTCRALDKFTEKLPRLLRWAKKRTLLFCGGENLAAALKNNGVEFSKKLMPLSERRYLFIVNP